MDLITLHKTQQEVQKNLEEAKKTIPPITISQSMLTEVAIVKKTFETQRRTLEPQLKALEKEIEYMRSVALEAMEPMKALQEAWLSLIGRINHEQKLEKNIPKVKLIRYEDRQIIFDFNAKRIRKKNSQHLLLLEALLFHSEKDGFISYENIENYFITKGLPAINNPRKQLKRIWDSRKAIFRFLGISDQYKGKELIKTCAGKGLMLYNPEISL